MTARPHETATAQGRAALRERLAARILATVGTQASFDEYATPAGDVGLFGPTSPTWVVHRDLPAMLIGGISALMLQTLHPLAMAGIAQHSNYKDDPLGRLQRTARFIAGTTFGPSALAEQLIASVRAVHRRVVGTAPDGRPYSAEDPALLTWVHTTEVASFLAAYQRLGPTTLTPQAADRYFDDAAKIAVRLGAIDVPRSAADVDAYFRATRPLLLGTDDARNAVRFLRTPVSSAPSERAAHHLVTREAVALLPSFARQLLDLHQIPVVSGSSARLGAELFSLVVRWAIGPSKIAAIAEQRVGAAAAKTT